MEVPSAHVPRGATGESTGRVRRSASQGESMITSYGRDRTMVNAAQKLPHPDQTAPAGAIDIVISMAPAI